MERSEPDGDKAPIIQFRKKPAAEARDVNRQIKVRNQKGTVHLQRLADRAGRNLILVGWRGVSRTTGIRRIGSRSMTNVER